MKTAVGDYQRVYFIGIGGIGMSALARYFKLQGLEVCGYDKTESPLTDELVAEGIAVHYEDRGQRAEEIAIRPEETLVIYTPAIPKDFKELIFFQENNYRVIKRAKALGLITHFSRGLTVAGTHGKTTTSTLLAHILHETVGCNAFLGGISVNYKTNYLSSNNSPFTVIEADEFDRSFLQLSPHASIITSVDADHLDIYGDKAHFREGFEQFAARISDKGFLVQKKGLHLHSPATSFTYSIHEKADYTASNFRYEKDVFKFDIQTPTHTYKEVVLGIPGLHNAENALACFALCELLQFDLSKVIDAMATFRGVERRFEYHIRTEKLKYIDDYAHHPNEIKALLDSVEMLYPQLKKIGVFQPHLFTRTRDFMKDFAAQLSRLDELILLPIYPARELPIDGITSEALCPMTKGKKARVLSKKETINYLKTIREGVVLTIGAGDIGRMTEEITANFKQTIEK